MGLRTKIVLVVSEELDRVAAVNAAMVTGLSLGGRLPDEIREGGRDASGVAHAGMNPHPVPVLTADPERLRDLHAAALENGDLVVVDFTEVAQRSRDHDEYLATLAGTPAEKVGCVALALFGRRGRVNALTKRLPLLR